MKSSYFSTSLASAFLVFASACNGQQAAHGGREYVSGTRLEARVLDLGEADLLVEWWDRKEQVACRFVLASDGQYRCLPGEFAYIARTKRGTCAQWSFGVTHFITLDEVNLSRASTEDEERAGCFGDRVAEVYELEQRTRDDCPEGYAPVKQIELARFVSATRRSNDVTDRFAVDVLVAEDGARGPIELRDRQYDQICTYRFDYPPDAGDFPSPQSALCMPGSLQFEPDLFVDAACEEPAYVLPSAMCAPYVNALCQAEGTCYEANGLWSRPLTRSVAFSDPDGEVLECEDDRSNLQAQGRAIKPGQALELATLAVGKVGDPVKIDVLLDGKTPLMARTALEYSFGRAFLQGSRSAAPLPAADARGRCLLVPWSREQWLCTKKELILEDGGPFFSDPECTKRVAFAKGDPREVVLVPIYGYAAHVKLAEKLYTQIFSWRAQGVCGGSGQAEPVFSVEPLPLNETVISVEAQPQ